ncbi:hypothetical protein NE237_032089 [Protea cynaroides]|uniref:TIR domain-containing protein n=1 Tax=Protea cynaroides TaxID=273540 RepID=A0A9Q0R345_9MAGN|nr:hypothetical protein NE237_032089 [Protea cynaroides]
MKKLLQLLQTSSLYCNCNFRLPPFANCNCNFMAANDGCSNFQVFLSYRWIDTGNTFTGFLRWFLKREKIDVFIDSKDLPRGEQMLPNLIQLIESSKISIPVISEHYADSKWCLIELAKMVERHESESHIILPIFFNVNLEDVKKQTGIFEASFEKLKNDKGNDEQTLKRWKNALTVVAGIPRYQPKDAEIPRYELKDVNGDESKLANLVVDWVLHRLRNKRLTIAKYPVGLEAPVKQIETLLNVCSMDVEFVGIHGKQGIGKTTIAKAFYNQNLEKFRDTCFLEDVRDKASKDLKKLQKMLIKSISNREVEDIDSSSAGETLIRQRLEGLKVLLILDGVDFLSDVDSLSQLDALAVSKDPWFGPGSKIIITTRKVQRISNFAEDVEVKRYPAPILDDEKSLELFSWHRFSRKSPPKDYEKCYPNVLRLAKGMPSTLIELGSFLRAKNGERAWEGVIQKLEGRTRDDIHQQIKSWYAKEEDEEEEDEDDFTPKKK